MSNHATLSVGIITRGNGKIFVEVTEPAVCAAHGAVSVSSALADGTALPIKLVYQDEKPVLVLPILQATQLVTVSVGDAGRGVGASAGTAAEASTPAQTFTLSVDAQRAKLFSRINTVLRKDRTNYFRNCDLKPFYSEPSIEVLSVTTAAGPYYNVRAELKLPLFDGEKSTRSAYKSAGRLHGAVHDDSSLKAVMLNDQGMPVTDGTYFVLADQITQWAAYDHAAYRKLTIAIHSPLDQNIVLWAHDMASHHSFSCFDVVDKPRKEWLTHVWKDQHIPAYLDEGYNNWFLDMHKTTSEEEQLQKLRDFSALNEQKTSPDQPTFSLIVPVYKTPLKFLQEAVDSVRAQTYHSWELLLVNASPEEVALSQKLDAFAAEDERIKVIMLAENKGITLNTQAGIEQARGLMVGFFDHDDVLEPDLLYWYADALIREPETDLMYCDEDKLQDGRFTYPALKPDWDPVHITGTNYVCHLLTVRKTLLDTLEPAGAEYDGAQDFHMTLRIAEKARHIEHVAKVLYHWRIHQASTAGSQDQKAYTGDAGLKSLEAYVERNHIKGIARKHPVYGGCYYIEGTFDPKPLVSIIVPNMDAVSTLDTCLQSLLEVTNYSNYEVIVVENNSTKPETFAYYEQIQAQDTRVKVITKEVQGFNFSALINAGRQAAQGDYLLLLNNDTKILHPDWIDRMLDPFVLPQQVGITGAKLFYPDGVIQHAGVTNSSLGPHHLGVGLDNTYVGNACSLIVNHQVMAVTGACLMIKTQVFDQIGQMDESMPINFNDIDLCLRAQKAGYVTVWCAQAELIHFESVTRGFESLEKAVRYRRERGRFMENYPEIFELPDPFWNINLHTDFRTGMLDRYHPRSFK